MYSFLLAHWAIVHVAAVIASIPVKSNQQRHKLDQLAKKLYLCFAKTYPAFSASCPGFIHNRDKPALQATHLNAHAIKTLLFSREYPR
jgi:hypothetical protein|tara:strand:- start:58843 stop:59106 length:264 start_codon:yes stop_codon:yes gene_type:complete